MRRFLNSRLKVVAADNYDILKEKCPHRLRISIVMPVTLRRIGASKIATVSAGQTSAGRPMAVKEFNRQPLATEHYAALFAAADRWRGLKLSGIVPYYEVDAASRQISMELLDRSAAIRLREGPSDPRLVLHTLRGALGVLIALHELGWVHANLKPSNVFFDTTGRVRLSDGLLVEAATAGDVPPLNLKYRAPEQVSQTYGPVSPASDLYCLGWLALELLAGEKFSRWFSGLPLKISDDHPAWSQWHASSQVAPTAAELAAACPEELSQVIGRMVSKSPELRYASAREVLRDLPHDLAPPAAPAAAALPAAATAGAAPASRVEPQATHVISRPATGVVLAIASGPRAGEMLGSNEQELMLGFDHDCFLRFAREQYPMEASKVLLRRGSQGWYALRVAGNSAFVNQRALEEKCPLRSGDIVRLSSRGPDVQFTLQSGGVAIGSLVERFLPAGGRGPLKPADVATATATAAATAVVTAASPQKTREAPHTASPMSAASNRSHWWQRLAWLDPRDWHPLLRNVVMGIVLGLSLVVLVGLLQSVFSTRGPQLTTPPPSPSDH